MAGDLRIFVLGGFRAEVGGRPVAEDAWRRSGAAALVKLLAVTPGHRMHREQLMDLLWPDLDQAAVARRLTKALHFARRALAAGQVRLREDMVSLEADGLWVDVDAFEAAARRGDAEQALAVYAGDLLPENRFDQWAERRRVQVRECVVRLLLDQGSERESRGDHRGAVASYERLVGIDPVHEEAHARLMSLAVVRARFAIEMGDPGTGRELAERLVQLGRGPSPEEIPHETLALVEALEAQGDHEALLRFLPTARAASGYLAVVTPTCDRAEGLARAAAGNAGAAEALLTRAVAGFERMSVPLQAARTREHLARIRPDRAEELLRAAHQAYASLGAKRDAARAESALAAG